jgi:hypothetical protein
MHIKPVAKTDQLPTRPPLDLVCKEMIPIPHSFKFTIIFELCILPFKPPIVDQAKPNLLWKLSACPFDVNKDSIITLHSEEPDDGSTYSHPNSLYKVEPMQNEHRKDTMLLGKGPLGPSTISIVN